MTTNHHRIREVATFGSFIIAMLAARSSLADHYRVPSGSMEPTVMTSDRVVVNKAAYGLRIPWTGSWLIDAEAPARGDVVVLESPESGIVLLKRVVAVGGDRVAVRDGQVSIDGRPADEHAALSLGPGPDLEPTLVPAGELLVLGDNRGNSHDGRAFGFVPVRTVLGRVEAVYERGNHFTWQQVR